MSVSVCLSVSLSVYSLAYLKNYMFKFYEIFCTCYMRLWLGSLGSPLTILQLCSGLLLRSVLYLVKLVKLFCFIFYYLSTMFGE